MYLFRIFMTTLIFVIGLTTSSAYVHAETKLLEANLYCSKGKLDKYKSYRAVLTGIVDKNSFSVAREYTQQNGEKAMNIIYGFVKNKNFVVRGKGHLINKNVSWDFFGSVKSIGDAEKQLKSGIQLKDSPNKKSERRCILKWATGVSQREAKNRYSFYDGALATIEELTSENETLKSELQNAVRSPEIKAEVEKGATLEDQNTDAPLPSSVTEGASAQSKEEIIPPTPVIQEASDNNDIEIFLATDSFNFVKRLDGKVAIRGNKHETQNLGGVCAYWTLSDYGDEAGNSSEEFLSKFVWPKVVEAIGNVGVGAVPLGDFIDSESCRQAIESQSSNGFSRYPFVSVVLMQREYKHRASFMNYFENFTTKFIKVADIQSADLEKNLVAQAKEKQALRTVYTDLARNGNLTHVGSITLAQPRDGHVQFCGVARDKSLEVPLKLLPETATIDELVHLDIANGVLANIRRKRSREVRYMRLYESLDDFFQLWQLGDDECHVFAAHPQDLATFNQAALTIRDDYAFLLNPIWEIEELLNNELKNRGFVSTSQIFLQDELNVSPSTIEALAEFNVWSIEDFSRVLSSEAFEDWGKSGSPENVLNFLQLEKEALAAGMTLAQLKQKKDDEARAQLAARKKRDKEKTEKIIASGDAMFGDRSLLDQKACNQSFMTCVDSADFLKICQSAPFGGVYNKFGLNPIILAVGPYSWEEKAKGLYRNKGMSAVSNNQLYAENGRCIYEFTLSGTVDGSDIYQRHRCPVRSMMREDGKLYPWGVRYDHNGTGSDEYCQRLN